MKWILISCLILIVFLLTFLGWARYGKNLTPLRIGQIQIDNKIITVEIADTVISREQGLSGRNELPKDHGMLFRFPFSARHGFWMRDMKFPIDIIWIKNNKVIGISKQAHPDFEKSFWQLPIYYPPESVDTVLEVSAGLTDLYSWQIGSVVIFPSSAVK